jgi:hypothetical protein
LSIEFDSLLHDIIGSKMHRNNIRGVRLQPPIQLVLVRDIDGKKPAVAFIVAVVLCVSAVVQFTVAHSVVWRRSQSLARQQTISVMLSPKGMKRMVVLADCADVVAARVVKKSSLKDTMVAVVVRYRTGGC